MPALATLNLLHHFGQAFHLWGPWFLGGAGRCMGSGGGWPWSFLPCSINTLSKILVLFCTSRFSPPQTHMRSNKQGTDCSRRRVGTKGLARCPLALLGPLCIWCCHCPLSLSVSYLPAFLDFWGGLAVTMCIKLLK